MNEHRLRIGDRDVVLLEGDAGWGECSPLPGYPCSPAAARRAAEEAAQDGFPPAIRRSVAVNALVIADTPIDTDLADRLAGFGCVKLKVGREHPDHDVLRLAALRELVGPDVALHVDANGAWDVDTAAEVLPRLVRAGSIELAEQPVATIADLAALRLRVDVPLAADECVRSLADARAVRRTGAADVLVMKVQPAGGVRAALTLVEVAGIPAIASSMLETSIGLAAGLALAAALPELPYACGLATLDQVAGDVVREPLRPVDGALALPEAPLVPDPDLLARYAVSGSTR